MPHISVAIPVFNRAHLIGRTIESVLNQEFQDYDVLVVDDASTDLTANVVKSYCDQNSHIRMVVNPKNLGLTRNWNRCIELSKGPLIQLLLSDDLIDSDYLKLVSNAFDKYPKLGFVATSCRYIDANGKIISTGNSQQERRYSSGDEAVAYLFTNGFPQVSSIVIRMSVFDKLGYYDEMIWHGPDVEFDARIASQYDIYIIGGIHTSFRRHGSNMGNLEYLRKDFLEMDFYKKKKSLEYLSHNRRKRLGIEDLDHYLRFDGAKVALNGAVVMLAYKRYDRSQYFLREALKRDPRLWRNSKFIKIALLHIFPCIGNKIMALHMDIQQNDMEIASSVENSLNSLQL